MLSAEGAAQKPACPEGNLLAGKAAVGRAEARSPGRMTDGVMTFEGDPWDSDLTSVLSAAVVYDLGTSYPIVAVDLQGDNNDEYRVEISEDGQSFTPLWTALPARGAGMRRRSKRGLNANARFVRLTPQLGDGFFSIAEFQLFCREPATWPPAVETKGAPKWWWKKVLAKKDHRYKLALATLGLFFFVALFASERKRRWLWAAVAIAIGMLGIATHQYYGARLSSWFVGWGLYALLALLLVWLVRGVLLRARPEAAALWWERGALVCVVVAGSMAWLNFGVFHNNRVVHYWDTYHYYVGSKYFGENEYERLYECSLAAEIENTGRVQLDKRKIRSLTDNQLHFLSETEAQRYAERCAEHFSPDRWNAFRQDVRMFHRAMGGSWWSDMLMDHGYNASPVSNMVASPLSNMGWRRQVPQSSENSSNGVYFERFKKRLLRFAMIDLALYAGAFLLILWAFGLRACALSVLVWGTGYPWAYFWTGGSFARVPWLFMAVASVCLLKRGYPLLSGFTVCWSGFLRLFPAVLVGGPAARIVDRFVRRKRLPDPWLRQADRRFIVGGLLGVLILGGASVAMNGWEAHPQFMQNSLKHRETPLTNHMGLPTILSYRPSKVGRHTKDPSLDDPWANWKAARKETQHDRRWLHRLLLLGIFVLLGVASRRLADWAILASSTLLIIGFFELTCYYYNFVILMAPLALERLRYVVALLGAVMAGMIIQFFVGWYDEQYIWETVVVLLALAYIVIDLVRSPLPAESAAAAPQLEAASGSDDARSRTLAAAQS